MVPELLKKLVIVSFYDLKMPETYSFILEIQSMIVTTYPKEKVINEMEDYFYPWRVLHVINVIITKIIV